MKSTIPERSIGSIPEFKSAALHGRTGDRGVKGEDPRAVLARICASHSGRSVEEELAALERGATHPGTPPGPSAQAQPVAAPRDEARAQVLDALSERVNRKFEGKLELARDLGSRQSAGALPSDVVQGAPVDASDWLVSSSSPDTAGPSGRECAEPAQECEPPRTRSREPRGGLNRNQRRALVKFSAHELARTARRFIGKDEPQRGGVWSTEDYRRIRAAVQDASGRAACCLLYQLGSREAARLARELDSRVPMHRRRIALAYAVARAPGSRELGETIKLGFALGLWSAVLADPNNPNMERAKLFRPGRRTLSSDLSWLQERGILKRWQVRMEHAAPCEIKINPNYPTNRYHAPVRRTASSMMEICVALGDVPPSVLPNPAEEWTQDDAEALTETREILLRELGVARLEHGPPS